VETDQQVVPSVVSVMVVHEPGDWFDETLRSLAAQDYPSLRSLFLLTPDSDAELNETTTRIRRILPSAFVRELPDNVGFGAAVNDVLRLVEGDNGFFLVCHDDIALDPRAVRIMVAELFRSNAGIVGPKLTDWDQPRLLQHVGLGLDRFGEVDPLVEPGEVDQEQHDAVRDVFVLPSACMLVRADLFRALSGFDPAISFHGDDVDLCWRAHLTGARVVIAPDARVRHRERLVERRPDLNHRTLQSRNRMRTVATLTGGSRLLGRSVQLVLLTLVEVVIGLFTGRLAEALASLRALAGLMPRSGSIISRRRAIRGQRVVPEREVLGLQDRGSSRLTSYMRGKETATFVGADSTVRRWREASFGPPLAWFCVIAAVVVGSRAMIRHGVPPVGEMLAFPASPRDLLSDYRSSFDPRSFGATAAVPTGWAAVSVLSVVSLFRMPLLMTMSVVGLTLLGALGAWRLATVFPATRARIAAMLVYVGTPLIPGVLGRGDWSALVWFAALPWLIHLMRRVAGIDTADPAATDDLVDGVAGVDLRHRLRAAAFASLVLALAAAFAPVVIVLFAAAGALLALATLLVGGAWRVAAWFAVGTLTTSLVAVLLNLPWALDWTWAEMTGVRPSGGSGRPVWEIASLAPGDARFGVLAIAFYLPVVAALAITRAWRLTWSGRGAALVVAFGAVAVLAERDQLGFAAPRTTLLASPVALGLALCAGALAGGFQSDVLSRGFGWRQPVAVLANAAIVLGLVPAVLSVGDGAWDAPRTPLSTLLASQLPVDPVGGDYRVLYVGDPQLMPVPGREYRPGMAYAVVDAGPLDFTDRFATPATTSDQAVERALDLIANGSTLRAGRLLAPHGIRFVVVPETDGVTSTEDDPIPLPSGLVAAIQNQLDIGWVPGQPSLHVFVNEAWMPVGAQLTGVTAEASQQAGEDVLVRADLSQATPTMSGVDAEPAATGEVAPGVVHLAVPFDPRLTLSVDGQSLEGRPGFGGVATDFDVAVAGRGVVGYERDSSRSIWLGVQLVLWLAVLAIGAGARASFGRRRTVEVYDETLIDLEDGPPLPAGVAGEVLATPQRVDERDEHDAIEESPAPPPAPRPRVAPPERDATPAFGMIPSGLPAARLRHADDEPDEVDLAGLVASVDDEQEGAGER
jgi:GT2 family glycosyltransferase